MPPNVDELMLLYAQQGLEEWADVPDRIAEAAFRALGANKIVTNDYELSRAVTGYHHGEVDEGCRFLPMPGSHDRSGGFLSAFFLPLRGRAIIAFELFLVVDDDNCLGFRFEPADDEPGSTHGYGHVQMNCTLFRKTRQIKEIPYWLPDSYPAFPMRATDSLQTFLLMTTSVHGYENGMELVLREILKNQPGSFPLYHQELKKALGLS